MLDNKIGQNDCCQQMSPVKNEETAPEISHHPNGKPFILGIGRPSRRDDLIFENVFPDSYIGKLLNGIIVSNLIKQEHRIGWARKSANDDAIIKPHPNETVAGHQWGVAFLVMTLTREPKFQEELPNFDTCKALEMALLHDVAELKTGDITPVDGISPEEKHKRESEAMNLILACFPESVETSLHNLYLGYENRQCVESKFVKDCDKLDFMVYAFLLERQGFTGFSEFYPNTIESGFFTKLAQDLADTLFRTRNSLNEKNLLYKKENY